MSDQSHQAAESIFSARSGLFGSSSDGYGQCCPPVFDPYTLLALIGGIALATYFLRLVIVTTTFNGRAFGLPNPFSGLFDDPAWLSSALEDIVKMHEELTSPEEDHSELWKRSAEFSPPTNTSRPGLMPEECRTEVWQCMSGVLETGITYVDRPHDIYSSLQPVLYKAVFHGGVKSMWSSVMEIPEMRRMGGCITDHDKCVEHNILLSQVSNNSI